MMPQNHNKSIWVVISILVILTFINFAFTQYEINSLRNNQITTVPNSTIPITTNLNTTCGPECQSYINNAVNSAIAIPSTTSSPTSTPRAVAATSTPKATQITYIPLTGGNTQNTDWVNVDGSEFTLNIGDYGSGSYAVWDANLRVGNANGETFARLYDTTHNIAVNGSEINVSNTSNSKDVVSSGLQFWQGNNSYVIQIKSLNSSTAYLDSGRIKITY